MLTKEQIRSEIINHPETKNFLDGIALEREKQIELHGQQEEMSWPDHLWVVTSLISKCLAACLMKDKEKSLHHTISAAAALYGWHQNITRRL